MVCLASKPQNLDFRRFTISTSFPVTKSNFSIGGRRNTENTSLPAFQIDISQTGRQVFPVFPVTCRSKGDFSGPEVTCFRSNNALLFFAHDDIAERCRAHVAATNPVKQSPPVLSRDIEK